MYRSIGRQALTVEFAFYEAHQSKIVRGHLGEFVVIKDRAVLGYYKVEEDAFDSMVGKKLGTFMVKKCCLPGTDIAGCFNNTIAFA
jgi:hypothetical protein